VVKSCTVYTYCVYTSAFTLAAGFFGYTDYFEKGTNFSRKKR